MDHLTTGLLDLLAALKELEIPLMVGGGFGLYLKRAHLLRRAEQTMFQALPDVRATNDLDLFLRVEILGNLERTRQVANALRALGYTPVEGAEFLQWKRPIRFEGVDQELKIDVLVGPLRTDRSRFKMPRVRPKGDIKFHAHAVEEAIGLEENPIIAQIDGVRQTARPTPGPYSFPRRFPT